MRKLTISQEYWLHPEDVVGNMKYIAACNLIIRAFGGNV